MRVLRFPEQPFTVARGLPLSVFTAEKISLVGFNPVRVIGAHLMVIRMGAKPICTFGCKDIRRYWTYSEPDKRKYFLTDDTRLADQKQAGLPFPFETLIQYLLSEFY